MGGNFDLSDANDSWLFDKYDLDIPEEEIEEEREAPEFCEITGDFLTECKCTECTNRKKEEENGEEKNH